MTTVYSWRWLLAHYLAKESVASITAFPFKRRRSSYPNPQIVCVTAASGRSLSIRNDFSSSSGMTRELLRRLVQSAG